MQQENPSPVPGIYITEISSYSPAIPHLPTTLPAFIGVVSTNVSVYSKISSVADFERIYNIDSSLHTHVKLYFENGGGECMLIPSVTLEGMIGCLGRLHELEMPTLLVIPEMTMLEHVHYVELVRAMLSHCATAKNRFALIDVYGGSQYSSQVIAQHRQDVGTSDLRYGASYFPFLKISAEMLVAPSAAVAGIMCRIDREQGIWKAPASIAINGIEGPAFAITSSQQEPLNVDPVEGKSINVIRSFPGKGTLIWGARTLAGNDNEWRYISVRRFFSWVEACIEKGIEPFAFEHNDATTWIKARQIIENFLFPLWRSGALQGSKPEESFYVRAGAGQTMTNTDVDEGRLIVEVGMAVVRPAEFIILRIEQQVLRP